MNEQQYQAEVMDELKQQEEREALLEKQRQEDAKKLLRQINFMEQFK